MADTDASMALPVRIVCGHCAIRYACVVDPDCPACAGQGVLAVNVSAGVDPMVAARAATLDGVRRKEKMRVGLLTMDTASAVGLGAAVVDVLSLEARSAIGRQAGRLLVTLRLREPTVRKPSKRRSRAEIAAERAQKEAAERSWDERRQQLAAERRQLEIQERAEAATLAAYQARHPEEFTETLEAERAMVAISDLPHVNVRGWSSEGVVARRAQ